MLRIWIFFNKQTIYLEETTAERNNQIAERACAKLERTYSWKYRHSQQSTYPCNCEWFNLPRLKAPFVWFRELDYGYPII